MKIGVSTASFYPLHVEDAFAQLVSLGVKNAEIFANSTIEGQEPIISELKALKERSGMYITSFHPFSSPMESVFLFSEYDRRIEEMLTLYRGFFKSMNALGAKIFVLHGAILSSRCTPSHYIKQFALLSQAAQEYGVTVAQENVSYCLSGKLEFLRMMKRELGKDAKFVLDLKQARRSCENPLDYVEALGNGIIHCHVSDADASRDCLPIGEGDFDFSALMRAMRCQGYDGAYIVELYRENYHDFSQLKASADRLSEIALSVGWAQTP